MTELTWEAPGQGDWWLIAEHMPTPVTTCFAELFPRVTRGWNTGGARYGLPIGDREWGFVNGWCYIGPGTPLTQAEADAREPAAAATLAGAPWRDEVRRWHEEERPMAIDRNRALQAVDPNALDDDALLAHLDDCARGFDELAPIHFEHTAFDIAAGLLFKALLEWEIEPARVVPLLSGHSPGSSAVDRHLAAIAAALDAAGAPAPVTDLAAIRSASADAASALDAYLDEYAWRPIGGHDLIDTTIGESPDLLVAGVNTIRARPLTSGAAAGDPVREQVPAEEHPRYDSLLADAQAAYGLRDDDVGICFIWPLGLVRRAMLEVGARLALRGAVADPSHAFEATIAEVHELFTGAGPESAALARRTAIRTAAEGVEPPAHLAGPPVERTEPKLPPAVAALSEIHAAAWGVTALVKDAPLHGTGIGERVARGRAVVVRSPAALANVDDGDVLVAVATTSAFNPVFPLLAAVVTQHGGLFSHTAIMARELDIPAVVGVAGVLDAVEDGDLVEVDAARGSVRVVTKGHR